MKKKGASHRLVASLAILLGLTSCTHRLKNDSTVSLSLPSRSHHQDTSGFYALPSGLADDYPPEDASEKTMRRDLEVVKDSGSRYLRVGIAWNGTELSPGKYDWTIWDRLFSFAESARVRILPYVCYSPPWSNASQKDFWRTPPKDLSSFSKFMYEIAKRYRGKALSWELWNEPDLKNYWLGNESQFAEMIKQGAHSVHQADPEAIILLGGMAQPLENPFFRNLLVKPQFASLFDAFNIHGYNETWSPLSIEEYSPLITKVKALIDEHSFQKDLWLAEFGYSDTKYRPHQASEYGIPIRYEYEHTPEYQAKALWKSHIVAASTNALSLMTWYRIKDLPPKTAIIGDTNNLHLGVINLKGERKPAFHALKLYHHLFSLPFKAVPLSVIKAVGPVEAHQFELKNGDRIITAWLKSKRDRTVQTGSFEFTNAIKTTRGFFQRYQLNGSHRPETIPSRAQIRADEVWIGVFKNSDFNFD